MARRKKEKPLAEVLFNAPWQVSAVLAGIGFIGPRWLIPSLLKGNMFLPALIPSLGMISWGSLCLFGGLALASYLRSKKAGTSNQDFELPDSGDTSSSQAKRQRLADRQDANNAASVIPPSRPAAWSLEALRSMEWKRFELVCARYYEMVGFRAETLRCGPDGGIDVKLFKIDDNKPIAIVQCKAWNSSDVGVKEIRELLGVMTHEEVKRGIFITTSGYTSDAVAFGKTSPIQMLDGAAFAAKIGELTAPQQQALLDFAFEGDYRTPTCPSCGIKMVQRKSKRGDFFGCTGYPRCKRTFAM